MNRSTRFEPGTAAQRVALAHILAGPLLLRAVRAIARLESNPGMRRWTALLMLGVTVQYLALEAASNARLVMHLSLPLSEAQLLALDQWGPILTALAATLLLAGVAVSRMDSGRTGGRRLLALAVIAAPCVFFGLRMLAHHALDQTAFDGPALQIVRMQSADLIRRDAGPPELHVAGLSS